MGVDAQGLSVAGCISSRPLLGWYFGAGSVAG
jgi:hypothetical protein